MNQQAQARLESKEPAPASDAGLLAQAMRAPTEELGSSEAAVLRMVESQFHVITEKLRLKYPKSEEEALKQIEEVMASADLPFVRAFIVDGLRTNEPTHFSYVAVRERAFAALSVASTSPDVVSVCVEEFQTYGESSKCCEAALSVLQNVDLALFPKAAALCREIVRSHTTQDLEGKELKPGLVSAITALKKLPQKEFEDFLIGAALDRFDQRKSAKDIIGLMARLGSDRCVALLSRMARGIHSARNWGEDATAKAIVERDSDQWPLMFYASIGLAVFMSFGFYHLIPNGWWTALAGVGTAVGSFVGFCAIGDKFIRGEIARKLGGSWNKAMVQEAREALSSMVPHPEAEKALVTIFTSPAISATSGERIRLADTLSRGASAESLKALVTGVTDNDPSVRTACLSALAKRSEPEALAAIVGCKSDFDPDIRKLATKLTRRGGTG